MFNLMDVGFDLTCLGMRDESAVIANTIKKLADNSAGEWDWYRPKKDVTSPALDFEGRLPGDEEVIDYLIPSWQARRFKNIWRQDRKVPRGGAEGYGDPSWESLVGDNIVGMWDAMSSFPGQVYDAPVNWYDGGSRDMTFGLGGHSPESIGNYASRGETMNKLAADKTGEQEKAMQEELENKLSDTRKELGITLNANGMPMVDFRDGSYAEVQPRLADARGRKQGVDADAEYVVIVKYPSLNYDALAGSSGYKTLTAAENMLANYARVHLARGLTYTY